jgi:glycosyltransferase involved in cell wall biosynthesis
MNKPIYADITELATNPIRSGIQRVVRQLLRHWPATSELVPCLFDTKKHALFVLPADVIELLLDDRKHVRGRSEQEIAVMIAARLASSAGDRVPTDNATILVPEVFFEWTRAKFYSWMCERFADRIYFIAYDFIPWLYPDSIGVERGGSLMPYIKTLQAVRRIGFISAKTRDDYAKRIVRDSTRGGPILSLGADGLALERQHFDPARRLFASLGSVDGRKNQHLVLRAFRQLWAEGVDAELAIVGRFFDENSEIAREIVAAKHEPRFHHHAVASDEDVNNILRRARATIYVSSIEGYGLPPVESLQAGIPVIAMSNVPSTAALPERGQIRIDEPRPEEIAQAVRRMLDDTEAARLWKEAAALKLTTWKQAAAAVAHWVEA